MDLALITSILAVTIRAGTSLVFATIGEIYTERSGVLNLGLEGTMLMGAVSGFAAAYHTESLWWGVIVAMVVGGLMALIHAVLTVSLRADQTVSGLALTIFGTGLSSFLGQRLGPAGKPLVGLVGPRFERLPIPGLSDLPVVGRALFQQDLLVYLMFVFVPLAALYLYRTRPGLHLRAVGESPQTADAKGIDVYRTRYLYTVIGGMLVGLGGAHLSLSYTPGWTENLTGGRGWIAVHWSSSPPGSGPRGARRARVRRDQRHPVPHAGRGHDHPRCVPGDAALRVYHLRPGADYLAGVSAQAGGCAGCARPAVRQGGTEELDGVCHRGHRELRNSFSPRKRISDCSKGGARLQSFETRYAVKMPVKAKHITYARALHACGEQRVYEVDSRTTTIQHQCR